MYSKLNVAKQSILHDIRQLSVLTAPPIPI